MPREVSIEEFKAVVHRSSPVTEAGHALDGVLEDLKAAGLSDSRARQMLQVVESGGSVDEAWTLSAPLGSYVHGQRPVDQARVSTALRTLVSEAIRPEDDARMLRQLHAAMRDQLGERVTESQARSRLDELRGRAVREGVPVSDFGAYVSREADRMHRSAAESKAAPARRPAGGPGRMVRVVPDGSSRSIVERGSLGRGGR